MDYISSKSQLPKRFTLTALLSIIMFCLATTVTCSVAALFIQDAVFLLRYRFYLWPCSSSNIRHIPRWEAQGERGVESTQPPGSSMESQRPNLSPLLCDKSHWDLHDCTQPSPLPARQRIGMQRPWPLIAPGGGPNRALSLIYQQLPSSFIVILSLCFSAAPPPAIPQIQYYTIPAIVVENL